MLKSDNQGNDERNSQFRATTSSNWHAFICIGYYKFNRLNISMAVKFIQVEWILEIKFNFVLFVTNKEIFHKAGFLESCYLMKVKSCTCLEESWRNGLYPICSSTSGLTSYWRNSEADLRGTTKIPWVGSYLIDKTFFKRPSRLFFFYHS